MKMPCPMCKSKTNLHSEAQVDRYAWEHIFCCTNPYCGCTFIVRSEVQRILRQSKIPDPTVTIPVSTRAAKRQENKARREAAAAASELDGTVRTAP